MKLLVFEYGPFKHAQREITPKLVWLRVLLLSVALGGVVWNLIYCAYLKLGDGGAVVEALPKHEEGAGQGVLALG